MNQITINNREQCPILTQGLVIMNIVDRLTEGCDTAEKTEISARTLNAFMRSCKSVGGMHHVKNRMNELHLQYLNQKYPVFANHWTPKSLNRNNLFPKFKPFEKKSAIVENFHFMKNPHTICWAIKSINPKELKDISCKNYEEYTELKEIYYKNFKTQIQTIQALFSTCKSFYNCPPLQKLYTELKKNWLLQKEKIVQIKENFYPYPGGPGWLTEILLTGWQHSCNTGHLSTPMCQRKWNEEYEKDAIEILKLFPESLNHLELSLRCSTYVSPFAIACLNQKIPLSIIELLLEKKADPNQFYKFNGSESHWMCEKETMGKERYNEICKLVKSTKKKN